MHTFRKPPPTTQGAPSESQRWGAVSEKDPTQIKIHHIGNRKNVVFKIDYEVALMVEKGIELRNKYPSNWKELLWFYTTDDKIMELVCLYIDEKTLTNRRFKTIKPKTKKEKELIKDLMND